MCFVYCFSYHMGFSGGSVVKNSSVNTGDLGSRPGSGRPPWRRKWKPNSSILAWRIPWTEEPVGYSPLGHKRDRHDLVTKQ